MSKTNWKQFERDAAKIFGTVRFKANTGDRLDFESDDVVGQCKNVKQMSLEQMTRLCEEMDAIGGVSAFTPRRDPLNQLSYKAGVLTIKVSRGRGKKSPTLVIMTEASFKRWNRR